MKIDKKAKILLQYNDLRTFVKDFYTHRDDLDYFWFEDRINELLHERVDAFEIEDEWIAKQIADFMSQGYTRNNIRYKTWSAAEEDNYDAIIEEITQQQVAEHFDGDPQFYNPIKELFYGNS